MGRRRAVRAMVAAAWFIAFVLPSGVPRAAETAAASQDCSSAGIAAGRAAFAAAYKAGDYAGAVAVFDKLAPACFTERYPPPALRAGIDGDYALAQHRAGSDSDCIQTLEAYSPELTKRPVPAMTRLPAELQKRIRFNFGLCRPFCDSNFTDVACYWLEADQQFDGMVQEDFRPAPCPFKAGRAALALPDGTCLAVTPSLRRFTFETATDDGPARACPGLAIVSRQGGKLSRVPVAVPKGSFLKDLQFCCLQVDMARAPSGHIELTPTENPPGECLSGHRYQVLQDVLAFRDGRLALIHRLHSD